MTLYNKEEIKYLVGNKDFTSKIKEPFEKNIINFLVFFSQEIEKNKLRTMNLKVYLFL